MYLLASYDRIENQKFRINHLMTPWQIWRMSYWLEHFVRLYEHVGHKFQI